jgi:uncharacterized protein
MTSKTIFSAEPYLGWLPWGALAPILAILFVLVTALGPAPLMEDFGLQDPTGYPIGLTGLYAFLVIPFALLGLLVVAWVRFIERRPLATIGLLGSGRTVKFLRGLLVGGLTISVVIAAIWSAGGYQASAVAPALASPDALIAIGWLLACFAVQASVEEILFRGWLLSVVTRKFNLPIAVVVVSLVFTLLHYSPNQHWLVIMSSFLFSAFACAWAIRANSIWGVMGWHVGWNWLLATGFELPVTGLNANVPALLVRLNVQGPDALTGGGQGPEGSFLCSLFFALGIAVLLLQARRERLRAKAV